MPFLALGALIGRRIDMIKCGSTAVSVAVGGLLFSALFVLVFLRINEIPIISLLCGIIGSLAALIIVKSFGATWPNLVMAKCGTASLVIFLLHPYFQGAARELILWVIGSSLWLQLTIPTVTGVVVPTLIWFGAERLGLQWLFRLDLTRLYSRRHVETRSAS
jgi:fucose 4-O-acetylase-like acetyltransferase